MRTESISQPTEWKLPPPEKVEAWGMTTFSLSPVLRPSTEAEILSIFQTANQNKTTVALR